MDASAPPSTAPVGSKLRETYFSETYQNKLYEREHAKPKNIKDFEGTYHKMDGTYHDLNTKTDDKIYHKRAIDHRDLTDTSHRFGTITGNVKRFKPEVDQFKNTSSAVARKDVFHPERKHYASKKTTEDIVGTDVLHQVSHEESKQITEAKRVPIKETRVRDYLGSSAMKDCLTLPTKVGEIEPKATTYGFGTVKARDVWAPKAYRPHANDGNQRFYID